MRQAVKRGDLGVPMEWCTMEDVAGRQLHVVDRLPCVRGRGVIDGKDCRETQSQLEQRNAWTQIRTMRAVPASPAAARLE